MYADVSGSLKRSSDVTG